MILTKREVHRLATEVARHGLDCKYHRYIPHWATARGGAEVGAWDAWQSGWKEALRHER